ncbi:MAG: phenylacetate-CoA oxygenase subunit PaaJ [Bacteroidota bacterium]|nr:phenylacetate-CoA oxygenase subunit PaaJ [Bacteroidota bacterium]
MNVRFNHINNEPEMLRLLDQIKDPEVPVLSVLDLGIIRSLSKYDNGYEMEITPTYSACPAMHMIEMNLKAAFENEGFTPIKIKTILHPPWTTDWMSETGKQKLKDYGIAPPQYKTNSVDLLNDTPPKITCPICDSDQTERVSEFGSTACKALYRCKNCLEPFDYFKCH